MKIDIAIISPMPEELEYLDVVFAKCNPSNQKINDFIFKTYEYKNTKILVAHSGLGTTFTAVGLTLINERFSPDYIFLSGTAGGIKNTLSIGDVIIAESAFEAEIQDAFSLLKNTPFEACLNHPFNKKKFPQCYQGDPDLLAIAKSLFSKNKNTLVGKVVTSNTFPAPVELFDKIKAQSPLSIDMETSAFYQTAWLLGVRALAVRGVSNKLDIYGNDEDISNADLKGAAINAAKAMLDIINHVIQLKYSLTIIRDEDADEVKKIVKKFNLVKHPEGGYYAQTYKSTQSIQSLDGNHGTEIRSAGTSIYYLLQKNDFSAWHRLKSDEIWHFHRGCELHLYTLNSKGHLTTLRLGDPLTSEEAECQIIIPAGVWFAAEVVDKNSYTLVGCTVSPGFEFKDFELGDREELIKQFPEHIHILTKLTRTTAFEEIPKVENRYSSLKNTGYSK